MSQGGASKPTVVWVHLAHSMPAALELPGAAVIIGTGRRGMLTARPQHIPTHPMHALPHLADKQSLRETSWLLHLNPTMNPRLPCTTKIPLCDS